MNNKILIVFIYCFTLFGCHSKSDQNKLQERGKSYNKIETRGFELYKPNGTIKAVLVLYGGFPEEINDMQKEFNIAPLAQEADIAIIYATLNHRLWLEDEDKQEQAGMLQDLFISHELPTENIYIGGFSSGGNMAFQISNTIGGMKQLYIDPKGVFLIDSPIDLVALYESSKKNIEHDFSEVSVQESKWIIETLESHFGKPEETIESYEKYAVYTKRTNTTSNLNKLKDTKIRLYTEPDTAWWLENRKESYEQLNAYSIKSLAESLEQKGYKSVEYIPSHKKGFRANGERHPHSWSIVDKQDLIQWMLSE